MIGTLTFAQDVKEIVTRFARRFGSQYGQDFVDRACSHSRDVSQVPVPSDQRDRVEPPQDSRIGNSCSRLVGAKSRAGSALVAQERPLPC
jgi:hypothetical protein